MESKKNASVLVTTAKDIDIPGYIQYLLHFKDGSGVKWIKEEGCG